MFSTNLLRKICIWNYYKNNKIEKTFLLTSGKEIKFSLGNMKMMPTCRSEKIAIRKAFALWTAEWQGPLGL